MRNTDATVAEPKDGIAAALREAFDAGKADKAQELKAVMDAFLQGLVSAGAPRRSDPDRDDAGATEIADLRTNGSAETTRSADPDLGDAK